MEDFYGNFFLENREKKFRKKFHDFFFFLFFFLQKFLASDFFFNNISFRNVFSKIFLTIPHLGVGMSVGSGGGGV